LLIHLRLRAVVPPTREQGYGDTSTPGTYCGSTRVPRGLSALQIKDAETMAQTLGAEVCPSCLEAKSDEDRPH
jgi:hypothetical protein